MLVRHGDRQDYANPAWRSPDPGPRALPARPSFINARASAGAAARRRRGRDAWPARWHGARAHVAVFALSTDDYAALRRVNCSVHNLPSRAVAPTPSTRRPCVSGSDSQAGRASRIVSGDRGGLTSPAERGALRRALPVFPSACGPGRPAHSDDEEAWALGMHERMAATEWNLTELLDAELGRGRSTVVLTRHAASVALVSRLLGSSSRWTSNSPRAARTSSPATRRATLAPAAVRRFERALRDGEREDDVSPGLPAAVREKWAETHGGQRYPAGASYGGSPRFAARTWTVSAGVGQRTKRRVTSLIGTMQLGLE